MQNPERKPPPAIVFDSSIEDGIGQVLALTQLLSYQSRQEVRVTSLSVSRNNLKTAAFCDLMGRFFGASLSIGMAVNVAASTSVPAMLSTALGKQTPEGKLAYARVVEELNDTADPVALIRNALTAQQDQNSVIVVAGPPVNLLGLLALPEGKQLIQKKVRFSRDRRACRFETARGMAGSRDCRGRGTRTIVAISCHRHRRGFHLGCESSLGRRVSIGESDAL